MKYQIVYSSNTGNTAKVAQALTSVLPAGQYEIVDFAKAQTVLDADVFLVGFGVRRGACPYSLLEWLEQQKGKKILLFATAGLAAFKEYGHKLESLIIPFLPDDCEYLGLYLCPGRISQEGYAYLKSCLADGNDAQSLKKLEDLYDYSQSHPDEQDLQAACRFVQETLQNL